MTEMLRPQASARATVARGRFPDHRRQDMLDVLKEKPAMIVDLRIYTCLPNRVAEFVALYEKMGWPLQQKHLGNCVGWYTTIEGSLNTVVHMWGYEDQADRERRRAAMAADPAWADYLAEVAKRGMLVKMENRIVKPAPFFAAMKK